MRKKKKKKKEKKKLNEKSVPKSTVFRGREGGSDLKVENTQGVFVIEGETSRSHEIDEKTFHEKLCASDGSGQPDECNSSSAHTVKEQHAPDEHRDIASYNADNKFNLVIDEENIDFNIASSIVQ